MGQAVRLEAAEPTQVERYRRRNLRIAVRQVERAELYLGAVDTLDLDDPVVEDRLADLLDDLASLRQHLLRGKG